MELLPFDQCAEVVMRERTIEGLVENHPNWGANKVVFHEVVSNQYVEVPCSGYHECLRMERMRVWETWKDHPRYNPAWIEYLRKDFYACRLLPDEWLHVGPDFRQVRALVGECASHRWRRRDRERRWILGRPRRIARRLAVGMALKERLGGESTLSLLGDELIKMIVLLM